MLIGIGKRAQHDRDVDVPSLLLDCHTRIRHFLSLATTLAQVESATRDEVEDAARSVTRYFEQALPLHVADEEQSILPRLRGLDPTVDAALATMAEEHREHEPPLSELLALMAVLAERPEDREPHIPALADVTARLSEILERHLVAEEKTIIPALTRLPNEALAQIRAEMRARRAP